MKKAIIILLVILSISALAGNNKIDKTKEAQAKAWVKNQQLEFIENKGQFTTTDGKPADNVLFKASYGSCDIYITDKGLSYVFVKFKEKEDSITNYELRITKEKKTIGKREEEENKEIFYYRLDMDLVGASILKENIIKEEESKQGHYNYFYPHCPDGIYDVKGYGKITIKNIYKGIDWVIYTNKDNKEQPLKYDFIVHPEANYKDIKIKYINAQSQSLLDKDTKLKIQTIAGNIEEGNIYSYQNKEKEILSKYSFNTDSTISFAIADYDKTQDLVIDPLVWATYYGGSGSEGFRSICTDSLDNIYIAGYTSSINFPIKQLIGAFWQPYNNSSSHDSCDLIILKFNSNGVRQWSTYYGGSGEEIAISICIDKLHNIYITGYTLSNNFPTQQLPGAFWQPNNLGGFGDAFILKFNDQGVRLWSTYYGGSDCDQGNSVCVDSHNNIFIMGYTSSVNFPTQQLAGAYWQANNGGSTVYTAFFDIFILKFDSQGIRQWATYYGGNIDEGNAACYLNSPMCIDSQDNIYITGFSTSHDFPTLQLPGAYWQPISGSMENSFILKFNNQGVRKWATYYGGNLHSEGTSTCVDSEDNVYFLGTTNSYYFPVQQLAGAFWQQFKSGDQDIYILKFNKNGVRLWATYYGGSQQDCMNGISGGNIHADKYDNIFITGSTFSYDLPTFQKAGEYYQPVMKGYADPYILEFNKQGVRKWATFYGSDTTFWGDRDLGLNVTSDHQNNIYFVGEWGGGGANTFNPGNGAYFCNNWSGEDDSYILKFKFCDTYKPVSLHSNRNNICMYDVGNITLTAIGGDGDTLKWYKDALGQNYVGKGNSLTIPIPNQTTTYYARWESSCDTSECDSIKINIVSIIRDTLNPVICIGETFSVGLNNYSISGTYNDTITTINGCDSIITTKLIVVNPPIINIGNDTSLCQGQSLLLNASTQYASYQWQDGTSDSVYFINSQGVFWVKVAIDSSCFTTDTINVKFNQIPDVNLGNDTVLCYGQSLKLDVTLPNATYQWQNGSTNPVFTISQPYAPNVFWVKVTVNNCTGGDTLFIFPNPLPNGDLGNNTNLCPGQVVILDPSAGNVTYFWQDSSTSKEYYATQEGSYWVIITDVVTKCSKTLYITLRCNIDPIIPNIFTPNGDGSNDHFEILNIFGWNISVEIFNRWGVKVYENSNYQNNWDGKDVADGVYYYIIKATNINSRIIKDYKGSVTILR